MKKLNLIETGTFSDLSSGDIVALTPEACYTLDQESKIYKIPEDYYDWGQLILNEDSYFSSFNNWIKDLSEFLVSKQNIKNNVIFSFFPLYTYWIKFLSDQIILQTFIISKIIKKERPDEVIHFTSCDSNSVIDEKLIFHDNSLISQLAQIICKEEGIKYTKRHVKENKVSKSRKNFLKQFLYKNRFLRAIKYSLTLRQKKLVENKKVKVFMLTNLGYGLNELVSGLLKNNKVYFLDHDSVFGIDRFNVRKINTKQGGKKVGDDGLNAVYKLLVDKYKIQNWINLKSGYDLSFITLPRFDYFIKEVIPTLHHLTDVYEKLFKKLKIDYFIIPTKWYIWHYAALNAAMSNTLIKTCYLEHGFSPFERNSWLYTNLPCNYFLSLDNELGLYHKKLFEELKIENPPEVISSQIFYNKYKGIQLKSIKNRIIYIPTFFLGEYQNLDGVFYPDCWYYKFQEAVLDILEKMDEFTFIYKANPQSEKTYSPLKTIITKKKYNNIIYSDKKLIDELIYAEGVITDYPSTPLIESLAMGIPSIGLYHKNFKVRGSALKKYGSILRQFENVDDFERELINFLYSNKSIYNIDLWGKSKFYVEQIENLPVPDSYDIIL